MKTKLEKKKWIAGLCAAVITLAVVGGAVYWIVGKTLVNQGIEAHNALNADLAAQKYDRVIRHYPRAFAKFVTLAAEKDAICHAYLSARQAGSDLDYETATTLYAQFQAAYPTDPLIALVDRERPAAYLAWAQEAEQAGTFRTAVERYQALMIVYPVSPQAAQARRAVPAAYYAAGTSDRTQAEYQSAIDLFHLAQEADVEARWAAKARQAIWETYREWGSALKDQGAYETAISIYQHALTDTENPQPADEMERLIAETVLAWSNALRKQGSYEQAIILCRSAMTDLPISNWQPQIHQAIQTNMLEWADALNATQNYQAAIATWHSYQAAYPDDVVPEIESNIARAYAAWAQQNWEQGEYQDALALYETLMVTYPDGALAGQARAILPALHYDWAEAARREQDYESAIAHYRAGIDLEEQQLLANGQINRNSGSSRQTPPVVKASESAASAWEALAAALYDWGVALYQATDYEQAAMTLQIVIDDYSLTRVITAAQSAAAGAYLNWGDVLSRTESFPDAVGAYEKAIAADLEGTAAFSARARLPNAYLAWGQSLQNNGHYDTALATYQAILDTFAEHPAADAAAIAIAETYNAWGTALHAQNAYADAMLKFILARQATDDERIIADAQAGYDEALWALAHLTDATGWQIINDAVVTACQGQAAISPAVGLAMTGQDAGRARAAVNSNLIVLPDMLQAVMPAHLRAAVCLTAGSTEIQRCAYSNGYALVRQQVWWKLTVRDASSGIWLAEQTFTGSMPKRCPEKYLFYATIAYLDGSRPDSKEIETWLRTVVK